MDDVKNTFFKFATVLSLSGSLIGCATAGDRFYDSAINDRNRAPASFNIPVVVEKDGDTIDSYNNQSQADFLYLKSEIESNAGRSAETIEFLRSALVFDSNSAALMQKLSVEYYKSGQLAEAVSWAEKAHQVEPTKRDVMLLLAGLYTTTKNYDSAELLYKTLLKNDANDSEAGLYLGAVYTERKDYPKAIKAFKNLCTLKKNPSQHLAHYYLARVMAEQHPKQVSQIKAELGRAIEAKPDFFEAVSMMAQYIQKEKGTKAVTAYYEKMQKDHGPQVKLAEVLAQNYISNNQYDKAYEQLSIIDEATDDAVQVKLKMALILIDKKLYDRAIAKLNEILSVAPESDKVRFYLSAVFEEQKDYASAYENYLKVDKTSSYFEESRVHAAYVAKLMGQLDRSVASLTEVIGTKSETPQVYIFLSQIHEEKKDLNAASAALQKATEKFTDNSQVYYYLGVLQDKMNLKNEMVESMQKVVDLEPDHSQALNYLAYTWAEAGQNLDKAESYARLAANKEKTDAFILDTLGWVLYKRGDYKRAAEVLEKAHALQPEVGIISEHLGDVYVKLNKTDKARAQFLKAQSVESDLAHRQVINQKLSAITTTKSERMPASVETSSNNPTSP